MKQFISFLIICIAAAAFGAAPIGTNISRYPNTNVAPASALLLIAVTNESPATNYNIQISDVGLQWTNTPVVTNWTLIPPGLTFLTNWANAISNYVTSATNSASVTNWTILAQPASANLTNWSLIPTGAMANVASTTFLTNWANAISNFAAAQDTIVSNGVIVEILNASNSIAGNSFARLEVQTNTVRLGLVTNMNWSYGVTGSVSSATAILGVDAATITTNPITGLINTNLGLNTNSGIFSVQYEPNRGSLWYSGTNGIPTTNEARAGMEFNPALRSLRMGQVDGNAAHPSTFVLGVGSNYWNNTNIGVGSVGLGSNVLVKGAFASVLGGAFNVILTNATHSVIAGGLDNLISSNAHTSVIGGGGRNYIRTDGMGAAIVANATIGGGSNNVITPHTTLVIQYTTIAGGGDNTIFGAKEGTISGGFANSLREDAGFGVIGGGGNNQIGDSGGTSLNSAYSTLCGGNQNIVRGGYGFIGGGFQNTFRAADNDYTVIAGGRNNDIGLTPNNPSTDCFVGGGQENDIEAFSHYTAIVGGRLHNIGSSCTNAFIGGGFFNQILDNAPMGAILAGKDNIITGTGDFGTIIGSSNSIGGLRAIVVGNNLTNNRADTVMLGAFGGVSKVEVQRATNISVGGLIIGTSTPIASAGAAETNLIAVTIPAHTLTNLGDRVTFRTTGRFAATANAKDIKIVYGSETILDTSSQIVNSGAWTFEGEIIRTGNTSQSVNAEFHGAGVGLFTTASSLDLVQTNGINTTLKVTSTAAGDGDVTNRTMTVWLWPAP